MNAEQRDERRPLHHAAATGRLGTVNLLLAHGAALDAKDRGRLTPLGWALLCSAPEQVVERLLQKGADVNADFGEQGTPLLLAVDRAEVAVVKALLERRADVNRADARARTPLAWARKHGRPEVVELLLARGASE